MNLHLQKRPVVITSKYSSPASLPLFFYVGYQLRDRNSPEHQQVLYVSLNTTMYCALDTPEHQQVLYVSLNTTMYCALDTPEHQQVLYVSLNTTMYCALDTPEHQRYCMFPWTPPCTVR